MHGVCRPAQLPSARLPASTGLTPAALTAIRTWPGPGTGSGTSARRSCSGPPNSVTITAFMAHSPLRRIQVCPTWHHEAMTSERIEVQRAIAAEPAAIFRVLSDPYGHVAIDSAGMLMDATCGVGSGLADTFVDHIVPNPRKAFPLCTFTLTLPARQSSPNP